MIKLLLFLVSLLVPILSLAQYTPGNYYLNSDPSKVYSGNLKVDPNKLIVQNETNKNFSFQPEEVAYVRTGGEKVCCYKWATHAWTKLEQQIIPTRIG